MKVLILGGSGMLGYAVRSYLDQKGRYYDLVWTERKAERISYPSDIPENIRIFDCADCTTQAGIFDLKMLLADVNPDYVINCIGIIKPRMADNMERAIFINALFPHILARLCKEQQSKLIHITTDCVFSGLTKQFGVDWRGYTEKSLHDCLDEYGKSKSLGEPQTNTMVLRTSIIGPEIYNKHSLISWVQRQTNRTIQGYVNHLWNGVTTFELAYILNVIMQENTWHAGIKHVFSPEYVTKYILVNLLAQHYHIPCTIVVAAAPVPCDRRLATINMDILCNSRIRTIQEQILSLPE